MKKIQFLLLIVICMICLPTSIFAKEYCKVISGNGKELGDEIACGSEHFYVIDSNQNEIKLLAKYNLFTGESIYKEKINREPGDTRDDYTYCNDLASSMGGRSVTAMPHQQDGYCFYGMNNIKYEMKTDFVNKEANDTRTDEEFCKDYVTSLDRAYFPQYSNYNGLFCSYLLTDKELQQSEESIGAHVDNDGNYLYPQYSDLYIRPTFYAGGDLVQFRLHEQPIKENTSFFDYDIINDSNNDYSNVVLRNDLEANIEMYKQTLKRKGFEVNSIRLMYLSELDNIIEKTSNKTIPFTDWEQNYEVLQSDGYYDINLAFGDIKSLIPKKYSWLYSTTYWNSSALKSNNTNGGHFFLFTTSLGKVCGAGLPYCYPETLLGAGVRPVISINKSDLKYIIKTVTDSVGNIEVVDSASGGDSISFRINFNKEYKLKSVVIRTDSGEEVEFTEGEIQTNDDGSLSVDKNKFTMPFDNVTIEARWSLDILNPKTGDKIFIIMTIVMISLVIGTIVYKKKRILK